MEIILGKTAGFCNGITRAVETAKEELKNTEYRMLRRFIT